MRRQPAIFAVVVLAVAATTGSTAYAGESPATFGVSDPGAAECRLVKRLNEVGPTGTERQLHDWAQGYFAGRAATLGGRDAPRLEASGPARAQQYRLMLEWCEKNPGGRFADAVAALWESLRPAR